MSEQAQGRTAARQDKPAVGLFPGRGGPMGMLQGGEKSKDARGTLLRLAGYLKPQRRALVGIGVLVVFTAAVDLMGPYLLGMAIDTYIDKGNLPGLARLVSLMLGTYLLAAGGIWLQNYLMVSVAQKVVRDIRNKLFTHLQSLPLVFFDQRAHGDLMSRLTNDVENISNVLASSFSQLVSSVVGLVGVIVIMFVMNAKLALVSLTVMPLTYLLTRFIARYTRRGFRETQNALGDLNGIIEESITGEHTVKAFVQEDATTARFSVVNHRLRKVALTARIFASFMGPLMNMVNYLGLAIVASTGGYMAVLGMASVGEVAAFVNYAGRLSFPLNQIASLFTTIQSALAGAERVFELMDETSETDTEEARPLEHIAGDVALERVNFSYDKETPVLKDVSLSARAGQMIALVGPTGAGKTTIANLLTRFYDLDSGSILVDGHNVINFKKDELRRKIGLVLQDNFLFAVTVLENIRYGRLEASDDEVIAAAKLANADPFIHRLPHGYHTLLAERGSNLSQGQRQLLAIARAVLADPDILILDEATSNVDTRTEKNLQEALMRLMKGRTSFVIAHRLSTIRNADQVLVIHHGEIIERGTHDSLLSQRGFYYRLYMSQFKGHSLPESMVGEGAA